MSIRFECLCLPQLDLLPIRGVEKLQGSKISSKRASDIKSEYPEGSLKFKNTEQVTDKIQTAQFRKEGGV